ncbi:MAG: tetratricopeptide repeat protein [Cyclonatronaceae bacterium]
MMNENRVKKLRQFLDADPDDIFSRFALALEYLKAPDYDRALGHFEYIRDHDPEYVGVYYHLGKLYQVLGKPEKALKTFTTGIAAARKVNDLHAASELEQALDELDTDQA